MLARKVQEMLKNRYDIFGMDYLGDVKFEGKEDFPVCPGSNFMGEKINGVPYDRIESTRGLKLENEFLNFYVHDKRFRGFEQEPVRKLGLIRKFKGVIGTDNSPYWDLPLVQQKYNIYLNRKMDCFFWKNGIDLIQNVCWSDPNSYKFCFDALQPGKTYAVSSHGVSKNKRLRLYFLDGLHEMIRRLHPQAIVFHGPMSTAVQELLARHGIKVIPMKPWRRRVEDGEVPNE